MQRRLTFIAMLSGFVGWSVAYLMIYAAQATDCRLGWQEMHWALSQHSACCTLPLN
ncbi:hypothetical protein GVN24_13715 [Rhizobium sp. CRIBSB]|nr:hypothetical protein [Rhizobium sp. CRIBSB]